MRTPTTIPIIAPVDKPFDVSSFDVVKLNVVEDKSKVEVVATELVVSEKDDVCSVGIVVMGIVVVVIDTLDLVVPDVCIDGVLDVNDDDLCVTLVIEIVDEDKVLVVALKLVFELELS